MKKLSFFLFAYWHDKHWKKFVGASVKIWDLAQNLSKQAHSVVLFLPKYNFPHRHLPFKIVEVPIIDLPLCRLVSFNIFLLFYLIINFSKANPDVVYVRRMNSLIPAIFAKIKKAILLFEVNDDPYAKRNLKKSAVIPKIRFFVFKKQDELYLKLCAKAFVITDTIADKILRVNPKIKPQKITIMPSGANTRLFRPLDRTQCCDRLGLDVPQQYICFIGSLLEHQGVDTLIDASPIILDKIPESRFLIIGEGPMKSKWIEKVKRKHLSKSYIFCGQIQYEELPVWLGATDVCVAPFLASAGSRSPVKIFDYMACGKAVVASKIEGTTNIFNGSGAIKLVAPEAPRVLAEAITQLLNDKKQAGKMGQKGRKLVKSKYDRKHLAKLMVDCAIANRSSC